MARTKPSGLCSQFYRSFTLPPNVNPEAINAQFKEGVLRLFLPKKAETKPRQIKVRDDSGLPGQGTQKQ